MKKLGRLVLLCMLAIGALTSCTAGDDTADPTNAEVVQSAVRTDKATGVYRITEVELPEDYYIYYNTYPTYSDGKFTFRASYQNYVDFYKDFTLTTDGVLSEATEDTLGKIEPVQEDHYVRNSWKADDGTVVFAETLYNETTKSLFLSSRDAEGNVNFSVDIAGYMGYDISRDDEYIQGFAFTVMDCLFVDDKYLLLTSEGLCALGKNGLMQWKETSQGSPVAIADTDIGVIYLSKTGGLRTVNTADGTLGDEIEMPEEVAWGTDTEIYIGDGYDCYVFNKEALWGVDFSTADDGTIVTSCAEVVNWVNSDIVYWMINYVHVVNEKKILANVSDESTHDNEFWILDKVPEDEIVEKEIITVAQMGDFYYMPFVARDFNRQSTTHRIEIVDYTKYEDFDQRTKMLNAEMAAGRVPDIIYIAPETNMDTTLENYVQSGIFADLVPLFKADETFRYDDLLGYKTKPFMTADGKLYYFVAGGGARINYGKKDNFDGPITIDEMIELIESLPEGTYLNNADMPSGFVRTVVYAAIDSCVDWENYTCSFDNEKFISLLDYALAIPRLKEVLYQKDVDQMIAIKEDKLLLSSVTAGNLYNWTKTKTIVGSDIVAVGVPNDEGKLIMDSIIPDSFAIVDSSRYKAEAVDFIEVVMNKMSEGVEGRLYYGEDVDNVVKEYANTTFVVQSDGSVAFVDDEKAAEMDGIKWKITQEDAEEVKAILNDIDAYVRTDTMVFDIATEEIWGSDIERTSEQIADVIQSRVSIYLAEKSR